MVIGVDFEVKQGDGVYHFEDLKRGSYFMFLEIEGVIFLKTSDKECFAINAKYPTFMGCSSDDEVYLAR